MNVKSNKAVKINLFMFELFRHLLTSCSPSLWLTDQGDGEYGCTSDPGLPGERAPGRTRESRWW